MSTQRVNAADMVCSGKNILASLENTHPEIYKAIETSAAKLPFTKGLLWKVEKAGSQPSFIFGTMHMSDPRLLDLSPNVQDALDHSSLVALEIADVLNPDKMRAKARSLTQFTTYTDGSDLASHLSSKDVDLVSKVVSKRSSLPWFLAKKLKPWAVMGAIATPACENARKAAGKPFLDQMLAQIAEANNKKLVSLETVESQIKAMASLPETSMLNALVETARLGKVMDDIFETMIQLYEQERIGTIWAMMKHVGADGLQKATSKSDYAAFQREIVDKRNTIMANRTAKLIESGGGAFVAVGALHLPGENGLLSILVQRGYKVSRQ